MLPPVKNSSHKELSSCAYCKSVQLFWAWHYDAYLNGSPL